MKFLVVIAISVQVSMAQFAPLGGGTCDYNRLSQAFQEKETCMEGFSEMIKDLMGEIQRYDSQCFQGVEDGINQCKKPLESFQKENDLDTQGVMDCCFPGRGVGIGGARRCEFRNKKGPMSMSEKHENYLRRKRDTHMMMGMMNPHEMMERKLMSSMTMGGLTMWGMGESIEMIEHHMWCMGQNRMINDQAMNVYREYKDKLIAKLFQCESIVVQEATNCTDAAPEDLHCVMKAVAWSQDYMHNCIMSCMPGNLDVFCKMFTQTSQNTNNRFNFDGRRRR